MAKKFLAVPFALAVVLAGQTGAFAATTDESMPQGGGSGTAVTAPATKATRAEVAISAPTDVMVADLPGGHWATNATQWVVANNILSLDNGQFNGNRDLTGAELHQSLEALANIAETIEGKGALTDIRASIGNRPTGTATVSRIQVAQALSRFLDAANSHQLLALGALTPSAEKFKDIGTSVPVAVTNVVDKYGVMTGYKDFTFRPNDDVTRYQMAAVAKTILDKMRQAPIAMQPATPEMQPPTVVVVPQAPEQPEVVAVTPVEPMGRPNFRQDVPLFLSYQALNSNNFGAGATPFSTIPVQGMLTGYQGPAMLQAVLDFRYDVLQSNLLNTELRLGYSDLKLGMLQFIPYVGATVGLGASSPAGGTQYDAYGGANYGGILSVMPTDKLELWGNFGQSYLLAGGRYNSAFQPTVGINAMGTVLSNYGVGLDFHVSPNIALSIGANTWQQPADLRTATNFNAGVLNTYGGNVGVGFSF
jgi:hypothetical protein